MSKNRGAQHSSARKSASLGASGEFHIYETYTKDQPEVVYLRLGDKSMFRFRMARASFIVVTCGVLILFFQNSTNLVPLRSSPLSSNQSVVSNGKELVADPNFSMGISVIKACQHPDQDPECAKNARYILKNPYYPALQKAKPIWNLAQWGSSSSLPSTSYPYNGGTAWSDSNKRIAMMPDGRIEMAVSGMSEFNGSYRTITPATGWPALILGQTISAPGDQAPRPSGSLLSMTKLMFNLDVHLLYENANKRPGYNQAAHAAIFPINFTIQNLNFGKPGFGQYVWLQISIYDDRYSMPKPPLGHVSYDVNTKSFIYFVPMSELYSSSVHNGTWVHASGDILAHARNAVQIGFSKGALKSGDLNDYQIGSANIGYELTGLNISTLEFRNMSLRVFDDKHPEQFEFNTDGQRLGWVPNKSMTEFSKGPKGGTWGFYVGKNDPQLTSPRLNISSKDIKKVIIGMANDGNTDAIFQLFWAIDGGDFSKEQSVFQVVAPNGGWQEYVFDLSQNPRWAGRITKLRIDPVRSGSNRGFGFDYIRFAE